MTRSDRLVDAFEENRAHLHAVARRLLGTSDEADDAVQECWIRLARTDSDSVANLGGWLTTVVGRVCLDMLRSRQSRQIRQGDGVWIPDPIVTNTGGDTEWSRSPDPAATLSRADSVGLAVLILLETLDPAERLAFVLHDLFGVPFDEIALIVERSPAATRKLASRARQRIASTSPPREADLNEQRRVADAFLDAARAGDFEALLALLDPDIILRADGGALANASKLVRGAAKVLEQAERFSRGLTSQVVLVNGHVGFLARRADGRPFSIIALSISEGRILEMDILADPDRIDRLKLPDPPS